MLFSFNDTMEFIQLIKYTKSFKCKLKRYQGFAFLTLMQMEILFSSCSFPKIHCPRIKYSLANKYLRSIPDSIFSKKDLQVLDLFRNKLDSLPDAIENLTELEELYLGSNNLVYISPKISSLKKLKVLSIQYNDM